MKEQHTTKNITPPTATLDALQRDFAHCFDKDGNFDIEKFKQEISRAEVNFSKESYGMDWLGKSYARVRATDPATTLLKEDVAWNSKEENKNSENLLIKGDNLEVLKHLSHAYHEQVKMIYIDPPYNTGTDGFVYEDDRKFTPGEFAELAGVDLEQAKRILDFVDSKSNSHSAWLSFMYPRLYIARQLLKDDGVIFVSVDDNEVAQLRILLDDIFGPTNFVGSIAWESKTKSQNTKDAFNKLQPKVEYILLYTKKDRRRFNLIQKGEKTYPETDDKGVYREYPLEVMNAGGIRGRESMIFEISGIKPPKGKQWQLGKDTIEIFNKRGDLFNRGGKVILKMRPDDEKQELTEPFWGLMTKDIGTAESAKKELTEILGTDKHQFETVKPVELVKRLIFHSTETNDFVLDFFAGSGTTGHAVMQLSAELGKRNFILVQLPEKINAEKNKIAFDYVKSKLNSKDPTIFDITKERLVCAAKKIKKENVGSEYIGSVDFGFKITETVPVWGGYADEPTEYDANLKMFDVAKLKDADLATLLTTWKTYDGIPLATPLIELDLGDYIGHYGDGKLYLVNTGFSAKHLAALLKQIDTDPTFSPATIILFGYHFESARMREIAENVKSYANKKSIDIECITRY